MNINNNDIQDKTAVVNTPIQSDLLPDDTDKQVNISTNLENKNDVIINESAAIAVEKITTTKTVDSSSDDDDNDSDKENDGSSSSSSSDDGKPDKNKKKKQKDDSIDDNFKDKLMKSGDIIAMNDIDKGKDSESEESDSNDSEEEDYENDQDDDDQDTKALKQQLKRDKSLRQSTRIIQKIQKQQQRDKAYENLKKLGSKPPQSSAKSDIMKQNFNMNDVMNIMNEAYGSDSNDSSDSDYEVQQDKKSQKPDSSSLPYDEYKKQLLADLQNYKKERRQNQREDSSDSHDEEDDDDDSEDEQKSSSKDKTKRDMMRFKSDQQSSSSSSSSSEDDNENLEERIRKNVSKSTDPEKILFQSAAKSIGTKSAGGNKNESLQLKDKSLIQKFKAKYNSLSDYTKKIDFKSNEGSLGNSYADLKDAVDAEYEGLDFDLDDDDDEEMMYRHEMEDDDDEDEDMAEDEDDTLFMNDYLNAANTTSSTHSYDNSNNSYSLSSRYDSGSNSLNSNNLRSVFSRNLGPSSHNNNSNNNQQNSSKPHDISLQNLDEYVSYFGQCNVSGGQAIRRMINNKVKDRNFKFIEDLGVMLDALDDKYQQEQEALKQQELQNQQAQQQEQQQEIKEGQIQEQLQDIKKLVEQQHLIAQQYTLPLRSLSSFDLKDEDSLTLYRLKRIALIYRHLLNVDEFSTHILEAALSNRFYLQVFKALEYHNDYADSKPYEYIKCAQFKSIIEFDNPMQQKRINTLFRASYLKETLFGKEDGTKTTVLTRLMLENSLEILKNVLNDHNLLKRIFEKAEKIDTKLEDLYNISKFIFELINRCKPIQGQLSGDYRKSLIPESLIKKVNTLIFVKFVFKNDLRVQKQAKILGLQFTPRELTKKNKNSQSQSSIHQESDQFNSSQNLSLDNMSSISQATLENFNDKVNSQQAQTSDIEQKLLETLNQKDDSELFKDKNSIVEEGQNTKQEEEFQPEQASMYDHMIVTLLDYVYYLQTICHKEVITYFLQDLEISQILSQHLFVTQNDGIRLQIIEIFKQLIDGAQSENQQQQIERLLKNTLFNAFTKIILSQNVNDFAWPVQYVFEFIQYICKPNIQQIQQMGVQLGSFEHRRERKINTFVLRNYIFEEDLIQITLNLISNSQTNQYVRLMGVKFLKSLINSQDLNFFQKMNKTEVMQAMIKALEKTKEKTKPIYNMLESTLFEFINMFTLKISEREPIRENFTAFIHEYQKELSWNKGLFKIFFDEGIQQKALNLGRTRASTTLSTHSSQAIVNSVLARYNPSLRRRLSLPTQLQQVKSSYQQPQQQEQESSTSRIKQSSQESQQQEVSKEQNRSQLTFADLVLRELGPEGQQRIQQSLLGKHSRNEDNFEEDKDDDTVNLESLLQERKRQRTEQNYFRFKSNSIGNGEKLPIQPQQSHKSSQLQSNILSQENETFTWDDEDDEPMQFKPLNQIPQQQQIADVKTENDNENLKEQLIPCSNSLNLQFSGPSYVQIDQFMKDDNNTNYNQIINDKINIRDEFLFDETDQFQDNDCGFLLQQNDDDIFQQQKQNDSMEEVMDDHMLQQLSYQQAYINNTSDNNLNQISHLNNNDNAYDQNKEEQKIQNNKEQEKNGSNESTS